MKPYQKRVSTTLLIVLIVGVSYYIGFSVGHKQNENVIPGIELLNKELGRPEGVDFGTFWKAWSVLNEKYVPTTSTTTVSDQQKVYGAIQGLASSLKDPYTVFFPPIENEIFQGDVRGNFQGVGMEVGT